MLIGFNYVFFFDFGFWCALWGRDPSGELRLEKSRRVAGSASESVTLCEENLPIRADIDDPALVLGIWGGQNPGFLPDFGFLERLLGSGPPWGAPSRETVLDGGIGVRIGDTL